MTIRDMVREILDEESAAAKAAKKAGLVHLGFGRYGPKKGGSASHVSKDGKLKSVGDDSGGEPADKPFGGDTGKDADYEPTSGDEKSSYFDDPADLSPSQKAHTAAADAELDRIDKEKQSKDDEYPDKDPINTKKGEMEDEMEDIAYKLDNVTDPEERKELEAEYDKIDQELYDINKKQYGDDSGYEKSGRTGKELGETKMMKLESLLKENPAAMAAVQKMTAIKLQGKGKRKVQATTALKDKEHPSHTKAVGIFQKLKDMLSKEKEDEPKYKDYTPSQSDTDFYRKQYAARTGKELGEDKMNESVKFHTITGNKRFMTKTALKILRKYGVKNVKVNLVAGDYLEVRFPIDSNKLKKLDKELKRKNKTAYGGIVETRRDKMTENILRKVIREEIRKIVEEEDAKSAFTAPIPHAIERYMKKFIEAMNQKNLNRRRKLAILGRVVVGLNLDPQEVTKYARLVKREI